ncbi:TonB-dependent receptor [Methylosinus sp.]|jgi:iron complex outermembrane receptor protein|uniref:TonB-dependent receptor n=1 Tax=Methylosinus sp. TaxID=427 RepID=UPI002F94A2FB
MGATAIATALSALVLGQEAPAIAHVAMPEAELSAAVRSYEIPPGSIAFALNRLADATGAQLVYKSRLTRDLTTRGLSGAFTLEDALDRLLAGTGIGYRLARDGRSVAIVLAQNQTVRNDAGAVPLPPIDIAAERERALRAATRHADGPFTPIGATQISGETLDARRPDASDAAQLLYGAPGVDLYEAGGVSRLPALHGLADDRIKILLGGAEITSACANHMNPPLSYIDPSNVGKIEVLSGVTPVSKGGDSIAGTISVEPKPPIFANPRVAAPGPSIAPGVIASGSVSGFFRSSNSGFGVSGTANVATEHFSLLYNGGYTRGSDYHSGDNGPKVLSTGFISENHSATLAYQNDGHLFTLRGGYQNIPYQGFVNQRMDMTYNRGYSVDAGYEGAFDWGKLEARAFWHHTAHKMGFLYDKQPANMPMNASGTDYGYLVKAAIPLDASNLLRIGNEFHGYHLNDWWPPIVGSMMMGPGTYWNINGGQRDRIGTFAEWEAKWAPQWTTVLGVRNDIVWMSTGDASAYDPRNPIPMGMMGMSNPDATAARAFNARSHARTDVNFDMTALLRYQADETSAYELGYSRKTRSPNLYERYVFGVGGMASSMIGWFGDANGYVGNPDLKPEVAHTVSFTAAWRDPVDHDWEAKATPYFSYVENFIDADRVGGFADKNGSWFPILQFRNHKAELYGFDLSGRGKLYEAADVGRFTLSGVIGYVYGENLDRGDGLYHIMPLNARFALEHKLGGWSSAVELQLVDSKTHVSTARNELRTPSYGLVNLRTSYEWDAFRIDLGVTNVADVRYYSPLGGFDYADYKKTSMPGAVPGPGRSYYAGMTVKF